MCTERDREGGQNKKSMRKRGVDAREEDHLLFYMFSRKRMELQGVWNKLACTGKGRSKGELLKSDSDQERHKLLDNRKRMTGKQDTRQQLCARGREGRRGAAFAFAFAFDSRCWGAAHECYVTACNVFLWPSLVARLRDDYCTRTQAAPVRCPLVCPPFDRPTCPKFG